MMIDKIPLFWTGVTQNDNVMHILPNSIGSLNGFAGEIVYGLDRIK